MGLPARARLEMTKHKTLKQRVRERQAKTGERYTTALAHLQAHRRGALTAEPFDATRLARERGFACTASVSEKLSRGPQPERRVRAVLDALKALLLALDGDAGAERMTAVLLHGEPGPAGAPHAIAEAAEARTFLAAVAAGRRGVSSNGRLAAFDADGQTVVATLLWEGLRAKRPAFLYLAALDAGAVHASSPWLALAGLGGWSR